MRREPSGASGDRRAYNASVQRRFLLFLPATALFVAAFLLLDRSGTVPQLLLGTATWVFLWGFARTSAVPARQVCWAVALATAGEVVLSIGWGLYTYQHALIPLYVPPGHGIFYLLAAESARQPLLRRYAPAITRFVLFAGTAVAATTLVLFDDVWGLLWWIAAAVLLRRAGENALLLSSCFVYTLLLEWAGTAIGNWRWASEVPGLGLPAANPPSGVGILYILLDLLTVLIVSTVVRAAPPLESVACFDEQETS